MRGCLSGRLRAAGDAAGDRDADRGAMAPFVVIFALTVFVLAGLVVDGGLAIAKREQAADIAEQAARYTAGDLDDVDLHRGVVRVDGGACAERADEIVRRYAVEGAALDGAGGSACTVRPGGGSVEVRVRIEYDSTLLSLVGVPHFTARARAVARPAAGIHNETN